MDVKLGDIFAVVAGNCCYLEAIYYNGEMVLKSLIQRSTPPFPTPSDFRPDDLVFKGNCYKNPELRELYKCVMEVNKWIHYQQYFKIPQTALYKQALEVWESNVRKIPDGSPLKSEYYYYLRMKKL
ncbi:hypothetical protein ACE38W_00545 [Chitinophaga sp. Hz27]|uniref:hypothetical protein n=1 Tax=Chitinophaga sp. Hz27 TaxID=3347169 RepID=UPI0035D981A8